MYLNRSKSHSKTPMPWKQKSQDLAHMGCGHTPYVQDPQTFASKSLEFLNGV